MLLLGPLRSMSLLMTTFPPCMPVADRDFSILSIATSFLDGLDMFQMNIMCKCSSFSVILVRACRVQM
jgi:hypothetical protein